MGFPDNILTKDEHVVRNLHPHWLTVFMPSVLGILIVAATIIIVWLTPVDDTWDIIDWIVIALGVIGLLVFVLVPFLKWRTTHYVITNKRVAVRRGILSKHGQDIALAKITDVSFKQTLLDRITRSGTLAIETAGDNDDEAFKNIPRSNEVQQLLNRLIEDDAAAKGGYGFAARRGYEMTTQENRQAPIPPAAQDGRTQQFDSPQGGQHGGEWETPPR